MGSSPRLAKTRSLQQAQKPHFHGRGTSGGSGLLTAWPMQLPGGELRACERAPRAARGRPGAQL